MSEGVFNIVAFGRQANIATAVAATTVFPVDAGFLGFEVIRKVPKLLHTPLMSLTNAISAIA